MRNVGLPAFKFTGIFTSERYTSSHHVLRKCPFKNKQVNFHFLFQNDYRIDGLYLLVVLINKMKLVTDAWKKEQRNFS